MLGLALLSLLGGAGGSVLPLDLAPFGREQSLDHYLADLAARSSLCIHFPVLCYGLSYGLQY